MKADPQASSIEAVKLDRTHLRLLLEEMDRVADEEARPAEGKSKRKHERRPYRVGSLKVTVRQNDREQTFIVPVRNISEGGLAFLHRSMLYGGTKCTVELECGPGDSIKVGAEVANCRRVTGLVHEIGLKFDSAIQLDWLGPPDADLMAPAEAQGGQPATAPREALPRPRPRSLDNPRQAPFNPCSLRAISSVG